MTTNKHNRTIRSSLAHDVFVHKVGKMNRYNAKAWNKRLFEHSRKQAAEVAATRTTVDSWSDVVNKQPSISSFTCGNGKPLQLTAKGKRKKLLIQRWNQMKIKGTK